MSHGIQRTDRPAWTATDGTIFTGSDESESEAIAHQVGLDIRPEAEQYVATLESLESERARTAEVNRIVRWMQWRAAQASEDVPDIGPETLVAGR